MNKPGLFLLLLLALAAGFVASRYSAAQSAGGSNSAGHVAMQRLDGIVLDLNARGDTNTLAQISKLLAARDTLTQSRDAGMAVALLERLRAGHTNQAIEVLEIELDGALQGLGASPQEIGEAEIKVLQLARQYRARYPRKQDIGVTRAFDLLERK